MPHIVLWLNQNPPPTPSPAPRPPIFPSPTLAAHAVLLEPCFQNTLPNNFASFFGVHVCPEALNANQDYSIGTFVLLRGPLAQKSDKNARFRGFSRAHKTGLLIGERVRYYGGFLNGPRLCFFGLERGFCGFDPVKGSLSGVQASRSAVRGSCFS